MLLLLIGSMACLLFLIAYKKISIKTSSMAVVMALGILTDGVLSSYFGSGLVLIKLLSVLTIAIWLSLALCYLNSLINMKFKELHLSHPINQFGIGTWVAGTSICGILISKNFHVLAIVKLMIYFNFGLWLFYILTSLYTLLEIRDNHLIKKVHGILLLNTVSTQSLVLLVNTVWGHAPIALNISLIGLGFFLYGINIILIIRRYLDKASWKLASDWANTNCIIHGALSITCLACIKAHVIPNQSLMIIWIFVLVLFLLIESFELYRMYVRIKLFGWKNGIFIYDVSQWSRLFTFGMFYTLTASITPSALLFTYIHQFIAAVGIWVIVLLVLVELGLLFAHLTRPASKKMANTN
ncbi:hypothetical protein PU629_10305 [Pullulanibacillus sp. KACC 23026]|uniref:hypothetical protein n=1 Tax=Pullulanibacillus sp. KACC 23026 TaxID=3028315 RepID=UPI0023B1375B|nr:hypothetical protein [Pullulanibacillus sp. KACC 23026]WEG14706.1 hypothetical protein PU629_10305 [Pullulanibacillus sp. KACC 23026]